MQTAAARRQHHYTREKLDQLQQQQLADLLPSTAAYNQRKRQSMFDRNIVPNRNFNAGGGVFKTMQLSAIENLQPVLLQKQNLANIMPLSAQNSTRNTSRQNSMCGGLKNLSPYKTKVRPGQSCPKTGVVAFTTTQGCLARPSFVTRSPFQQPIQRNLATAAGSSGTSIKGSRQSMVVTILKKQLLSQSSKANLAAKQKTEILDGPHKQPSLDAKAVNYLQGKCRQGINMSTELSYSDEDIPNEYRCRLVLAESPRIIEEYILNSPTEQSDLALNNQASSSNQVIVETLNIIEQGNRSHMTATISRVLTKQQKFVQSKDSMMSGRPYSKSKREKEHQSALTKKLAVLNTISGSPAFLLRRSEREEYVASLNQNQNNNSNININISGNQQKIRVSDSRESTNNTQQMTDSTMMQNEKQQWSHIRRRLSEDMSGPLAFAQYRDQQSKLESINTISAGNEVVPTVATPHRQQQQIQHALTNMSAALSAYKNQPLISIAKRSDSRGLRNVRKEQKSLANKNARKKHKQKAAPQETNEISAKNSVVTILPTNLASNKSSSALNNKPQQLAVDQEQSHNKMIQEQDDKFGERLPQVVTKAKLTTSNMHQGPHGWRHVNHKDNTLRSQVSQSNLNGTAELYKLQNYNSVLATTNIARSKAGSPLMLNPPTMIKGGQRFTKPLQAQQSTTRGRSHMFYDLGLAPPYKTDQQTIISSVETQKDKSNPAVRLPDLNYQQSKSIQSFEIGGRSGEKSKNAGSALSRGMRSPSPLDEIEDTRQGDLLLYRDSMRIEIGDSSRLKEGQVDFYDSDDDDDDIARSKQYEKSKVSDIRKSNKSLGCKRKKRRKQLLDSDVSQFTHKTGGHVDGSLEPRGLDVSNSQEARQQSFNQHKRRVKLVSQFEGIQKAYNGQLPTKQHTVIQSLSNKRLKNKSIRSSSNKNTELLPSQQSIDSQYVPNCASGEYSGNLNIIPANSKWNNRRKKNSTTLVEESPYGNDDFVEGGVDPQKLRSNYQSTLDVGNSSPVGQTLAIDDLTVELEAQEMTFDKRKINKITSLVNKSQKLNEMQSSVKTQPDELIDQPQQQQVEPTEPALTLATSLIEVSTPSTRVAVAEANLEQNAKTVVTNSIEMKKNFIDVPHHLTIQEAQRQDLLGSPIKNRDRDRALADRKPNNSDLVVVQHKVGMIITPLQRKAPRVALPIQERKEAMQAENIKPVKFQHSPNRNALATTMKADRNTQSFFRQNETSATASAKATFSSQPDSPPIRKVSQQQRVVVTRNKNAIPLKNKSQLPQPEKVTKVELKPSNTVKWSQKPIKRTLNRLKGGPVKLTLSDFEVLGILGRGAFGHVSLVKQKATGELFALKKLEKEKIRGEKLIQHVMNERNIMRTLSHNKEAHRSFFVKLIESMQDETSLYLLLEFLPGGELLCQIRSQMSLTQEDSVFYLAEVLIALKQLHEKNIIYRDLKPENVLLDKHGHVKLIDFGFAKQLVNRARDRAHTNCGTADYAAPEVIIGGSAGYTHKADIWSFGILICEMLGGFTPFGPKAMEIGAAQNGSDSPGPYAAIPADQIIEQANSGRIILPKNLTPVTRDLVKRILVPDLGVRLDSHDIMKHKFFEGVDWNAVECRRLEPPFIPEQVDLSSVPSLQPETIPTTALAITPLDMTSDGELTSMEYSTTAATQIGRTLLAQPNQSIPQIVLPLSRQHVKSNLSNYSSPIAKRKILGDFHLSKINQIFQDF